MAYTIHRFNEFGEPISYDTLLHSLYHTICYTVTSQCDPSWFAVVPWTPFTVAVVVVGGTSSIFAFFVGWVVPETTSALRPYFIVGDFPAITESKMGR